MTDINEVEYQNLSDSLKEQVDEYAITEALCTVLSEYEGGGYDALRLPDEDFVPWAPLEDYSAESLEELAVDFERQFRRAWLAGYSARIEEERGGEG